MKTKRKNQKKRIVLAAALAILTIAFCAWAVVDIIWGGEHVALPGIPAIKNTGRDSTFAGSLLSRYAYLMDRSDRAALLDKDGEQRIYPASMTKIMTVLLGVESFQDLDEQVQLPDDFGALYAADASMAGFEPGELVTAEDLLYGAMLPSGADACLGIAVAVSGSEPAFVERMNSKAQELGMTGTHFTNADGLHDPEHYSTARDIAVLLDYALREPAFYRVFTAQRYQAQPTAAHPEGLWFTSTLSSAAPYLDFDGGEILGGKTGYTDEAGLCLASLGAKNGKAYILVTAKAPGGHQTEPYHIEDALRIYENFL